MRDFEEVTTNRLSSPTANRRTHKTSRPLFNNNTIVSIVLEHLTSNTGERNPPRVFFEDDPALDTQLACYQYADHVSTSTARDPSSTIAILLRRDVYSNLAQRPTWNSLALTQRTAPSHGCNGATSPLRTSLTDLASLLRTSHYAPGQNHQWMTRCCISCW
jgi:hypothetical protein